MHPDASGSLFYLSGMGLQGFFCESATLPQVKQISRVPRVGCLISPNGPRPAIKQMCP